MEYERKEIDYAPLSLSLSPSGLSYEDTYNTLRYADRAKQIKTKVSNYTASLIHSVYSW